MKTIFPCWDNGKKSYEKGGRMQCDVCGSLRVQEYGNTEEEMTQINGGIKLLV